MITTNKAWYGDEMCQFLDLESMAKFYLTTSNERGELESLRDCLELTAKSIGRLVTVLHSKGVISTQEAGHVIRGDECRSISIEA